MKSINIKGKQYITVNERVLEFHKLHPHGHIVTELVSTPDAERVVVKATVRPDVSDPNRWFTGFSQAKWEGNINSTSALENAETSAVGRALGMMGIGIVEGIASADEINKAVASGNRTSPASIKMPQRKPKPGPTQAFVEGLDAEELDKLFDPPDPAKEMIP